jgi:hypothetical protein
MNTDKNYEITHIAAKLTEGRANGLTVKSMEPAFDDKRVDSHTLRYHLDLAANTFFDECVYESPGNRMVGVFIAAGLLRRKDLQRAGTPLRFTMNPAPDCPIQYREHSAIGARTYRQYSHLLTAEPAIPIEVPGPIRSERTLTLSPGQRSFLAALLLGVSTIEINREHISHDAPSDIRRLAKWSGLSKPIQLAAHCAAIKAIEVPEEILSAKPSEADVQPIIYTQPFDLAIPLGVKLSPDDIPPPHSTYYF